jgi:hypothetical protein
MREPGDFVHLDGPAFLNERAYLRGRLEHTPENANGRTELEQLYEAMTEEFLRRARIAWTSAPAKPRFNAGSADATADAVNRQLIGR